MWTIDRSFESFDDFLDHLDNNQPAWRADRLHTVNSAPSTWNGNVTFAQAMNLARYGWPEGRDHMSTVTCDMRPENVEVSEHVTREMDVAGAYPIVAMAVAGDPCHMVDITETDASSRIIRCVISLGKSAMIKAKSAIANGAAVASYIDALELAGWSCEIWVQANAKAGDGRESGAINVEICVKRAGEMLDIDRLAFALISPAMHRRLIFRVREIEAKAENLFHDGYGVSYSKRPDDCQLFAPHIDEQLTNDQALKRIADSFEVTTE